MEQDQHGQHGEPLQQRRITDSIRGFVLLSHPIPVLLHILAVAGFAFFAAWPHLIWSVFVPIVAAHAVMQLSIAFLNDYCDRQLDSMSKRNKPIVLGLVRPREALIASIICMVVMVLLLVRFPLALLISCCYLVLGQGYNLGLKSTPFSGIVFALAFPLIPLYAFAGVGHMPSFILWLVPVASLLGCAINLANAASDIEEDEAHGAYTLAVVLRKRGVYWACPLLITCSIVLIGLLTVTQTVHARQLLIGMTFVITMLGVFVLLSNKNVAQKRYFYLVVGISFIVAAGWLAGVLI